MSDNSKDVKKIFLPKDMPNFCQGCFQCFTDNTKCPDYQYTEPILEAMDEANLIIFVSPVYVYHITGQMKAFLDHFAFRWMAHQPSGKMLIIKISCKSMRFMQKKFAFNEPDVKYWKELGWLEKRRPWKD